MIGYIKLSLVVAVVALLYNVGGHFTQSPEVQDAMPIALGCMFVGFLAICFFMPARNNTAGPA
jgi:hypothetical protein